MLEVGGFNENLARNQDLDLHSRMRRAGWKFFLDPAIRTVYHARGTLKGMAKEAWQNGWWVIMNIVQDPRAVSLRHLVPLGFVLLLLVTFLGGFAWHPLWLALAVVLGVYALTAVIASIPRTHHPLYIVMKPFLFFVLHASYGCGSAASLVCLPFQWQATARIRQTVRQLAEEPAAGMVESEDVEVKRPVSLQ